MLLFDVIHRGEGDRHKKTHNTSSTLQPVNVIHGITTAIPICSESVVTRQLPDWCFQNTAKM